MVMERRNGVSEGELSLSLLARLLFSVTTRMLWCVVILVRTCYVECCGLTSQSFPFSVTSNREAFPLKCVVGTRWHGQDTAMPYFTPDLSVVEPVLFRHLGNVRAELASVSICLRAFPSLT
jgi:hypothetical protein